LVIWWNERYWFVNENLSNDEEDFFGDVWRFDYTNWAYWSGPKTKNAFPVYGPYKSFSQAYHPGGRSVSSITNAGNAVYIIAGLTTNDSISDIWKFDYEKGWALWAGEVAHTSPRYGTLRVPSENNLFGSRLLGYAHVDQDENIWIHAGGEEGFSQDESMFKWLY
jgi:hypothetical protein